MHFQTSDANFHSTFISKRSSENSVGKSMSPIGHSSSAAIVTTNTTTTTICTTITTVITTTMTTSSSATCGTSSFVQDLAHIQSQQCNVDGSCNQEIECSEEEYRITLIINWWDSRVSDPSCVQYPEGHAQLEERFGKAEAMNALLSHSPAEECINDKQLKHDQHRENRSCNKDMTPFAPQNFLEVKTSQRSDDSTEDISHTMTWLPFELIMESHE
jgi:hypothetical protein